MAKNFETVDEKYSDRDKKQFMFKDTDVPKKDTLTVDDLVNAKAALADHEEYLDDSNEDEDISR